MLYVRNNLIKIVSVFHPLPSRVMMPDHVGWLLVKKHLSQSICFPRAFPDRDRWCPFKRSHGSALFLVLDTETHRDTLGKTNSCRCRHPVASAFVHKHVQVPNNTASTET